MLLLCVEFGGSFGLSLYPVRKRKSVKRAPGLGNMTAEADASNASVSIRMLHVHERRGKGGWRHQHGEQANPGGPLVNHARIKRFLVLENLRRHE